MRAEHVETAPVTMRGNLRLRSIARLLAIGLQLAGGLLVAAVVFPFASLSQRLALGSRWARGMIRAAGIELRVEGAELATGTLFVANHVSWLDILAIAALAPTVFVAKVEVRHWPAIGWLAARVDTLFIRRGSGRSLLGVKNRMAELLAAGRNAAVFPEGTTTDGASVLPFRSGLLQAAVDSGRPVQPVGIAYCGEDGELTKAAAFVDGMTLWDSIITLCRSKGIVLHLTIAAPLPAIGRSRKELAREARGVIAGIFARKLAAAASPEPNASSEPEVELNSPPTQLSTS
jgi:1-acyl-sn-glycerol-3-phosphate acyltransferase